MEAITHSQVHEIIKRLPARKLARAYSFLIDLAEKESDIQSPQVNFMLLPQEERRRMLAEQARQMAAHYDQTAEERELWQSGDFANEY